MRRGQSKVVESTNVAHYGEWGEPIRLACGVEQDGGGARMTSANDPRQEGGESGGRKPDVRNQGVRGRGGARWGQRERRRQWEEGR